MRIWPNTLRSSAKEECVIRIGVNQDHVKTTRPVTLSHAHFRKMQRDSNNKPSIPFHKTCAQIEHSYTPCIIYDICKSIQRMKHTFSHNSPILSPFDDKDTETRRSVKQNRHDACVRCLSDGCDLDPSASFLFVLCEKMDHGPWDRAQPFLLHMWMCAGDCDCVNLFSHNSLLHRSIIRFYTDRFRSCIERKPQDVGKTGEAQTSFLLTHTAYRYNAFKMCDHRSRIHVPVLYFIQSRVYLKCI